MNHMTDFTLLKLPTGRRIFMLLLAVMVISAMFAPMQELPVLRNELGAFAGTACLLVFLVWRLKKEQLPLAQLFREGRYTTPTDRLKNVLYLFPVYIAVFLLLACYLIPGVILLAGKLVPLDKSSFTCYTQYVVLLSL